MNAVVDIRVLHCGQGDTLLLHLDESKWVLLDCNLPSPEAIQRFFVQLAGLGVEKLDLLCLSHPDKDHYAGMLRVLEHFSTPPRSIGAFCDAGIAGKLVPSGTPPSLDAELVELYRNVIRLAKAGRLEYHMAVAGSTLAAESSVWAESLIAISPSGSRVHLANLEALVDGIHCSPNDFSMVLVLEAGEDPQSFRGLLTGDAGGLIINEALTRFVAVRKPALNAMVFDLVKIPHHGSWRSHIDSDVPKMIRIPNESVAVVSSCSQNSRLPRREVLQAYLRKGWCVYDTGKRRNLTDRFFNLLAWTEGVEGKYDVCVSWEAAGGLKVGPVEARVGIKDVGLYPSGATEG